MARLVRKVEKVAIFISSLSGGGMERAMLNVAKYLQSQGLSVDFLVASSKGILIEEALANVNLIDLSKRSEARMSIRWWLLKSIFSVESLFLFVLFIKKLPKSIKVIPELEKYIEQNSPDVILSTPTSSNLALLWAARSCNFNKKIVIREATTLSLEVERNTSLFYKFLKKLVRKWYNFAEAIVCVSNGVSEDLITNFGVQETRTVVISSLIDIEGIKQKANLNEHDLIIKNYQPYVLAVGRLDTAKDYETLIRAYAEIADKTKCKLLILGEGSERKKLQILINNLGMSNRVLLLGFFKNPYPFIKHCEVLAMSSKQEGLPNVLREALLLNKKIISTDCKSGPAEILKNGLLGRLVEVGDVEQFSSNLLEMIELDKDFVNNHIEDWNAAAVKFYKECCVIK